MEVDRAQVDLGVAEQSVHPAESPAPARQPKKRFVGRRQADENVAKNSSGSAIEDSGAIQGMRYVLKFPSSVD